MLHGCKFNSGFESHPFGDVIMTSPKGKCVATNRKLYECRKFNQLLLFIHCIFLRDWKSFCSKLRAITSIMRFRTSTWVLYETLYCTFRPQAITCSNTFAAHGCTVSILTIYPIPRELFYVFECYYHLTTGSTTIWIVGFPHWLAIDRPVCTGSAAKCISTHAGELSVMLYEPHCRFFCWDRTNNTCIGEDHVYFGCFMSDGFPSCWSSPLSDSDAEQIWKDEARRRKSQAHIDSFTDNVGRSRKFKQNVTF